MRRPASPARAPSIIGSTPLVPAGTEPELFVTPAGRRAVLGTGLLGPPAPPDRSRARPLSGQRRRPPGGRGFAGRRRDGHLLPTAGAGFRNWRSASKTQEIAKDSLGLVELRHERGAASGLDVHQAEQLLYTAGAQIAAAERAIAQSENLLSLLQGSAPAAQARGASWKRSRFPRRCRPVCPPRCWSAVPISAQAEQNLVAANAQIGAARALYFPQLSLSAFRRRAEPLAVGPCHRAGARLHRRARALQSIFTPDRFAIRCASREAQQRELLINYQRSIYTALREVADALISFDRLREQRSQEEQLVHTLEETVRLSNCAIAAAWTAICRCLDAQRNLFSGQLALAQLRLQERVSVVQLYRALGGGWS